MKTSHIRKTRNTLATIVVAVLFVSAYVANPSFFSTQNVQAAATDNVSGWAYSMGNGALLNDAYPGIGWISFNNTSDGSATAYGVNLDTTNRGTGGTGDFSGSAWSSNVDTTVTPNQGGIGWISFDRAKTGNPPSAPFNGVSGPIAQINWSTGNVTGWARALSACQTDKVDASGNCTANTAGSAAGGWDGWIKLSDDTGAVPTWTGTGVKIDLVTNKFSGYAWGSDVVGWIDFAPAIMGANVVHLPPIVAVPDLTAGSATPTTATVNTATTFSAQVTNSGSGSTGASFSNFFQVATAANGGGTVTDLTSSTMSTLAAGVGATATSPAYTFTTATTYSVRVCADKTSSAGGGVINEPAPSPNGEFNNCGPAASSWTNVTVSSASVVCGTGLAYVSGSCVPCNGGCTGTGGTTTNPTGSLVCSNGANNPWTCTQCPDGQAYSSGFCVACGGTGCSGTGGTPSVPNGGLSCNNGASVPPFCVLSNCTLPWGATMVSGATPVNAYSVSSVAPPATSCPTPQQYTCTNGVLSGSTYQYASCTVGICGNNNCETGETILNCPSDCSGGVVEF